MVSSETDMRILFQMSGYAIKILLGIIYYQSLQH